MIHFKVRHLMGVLECHQLIAVPITTEKKKIQSSVRCYAILITTGKKDIVVWPSFVAPFQLPLLRRSNYDQKKRYSRLSIVMPFQFRPKKKEDTVVWPSFAAPFQLPLLVAPFQLRPEKKKIQSSVRCYAIPITTGKKDTVVWPSFVAPF